MAQWRIGYEIEQRRLKAVAILERRGVEVPEHYIGKRRHEADGIRLCMPSTETQRAYQRRKRQNWRARQKAKREALALHPFGRA